MTKPANLYIPATDANFAPGSDAWSGQPTKVAPSAGELAQGFTPGVTVPMEWLNLFLNNHGEWLQYLEEIADDLGKWAEYSFGPGWGLDGDGNYTRTFTEVMNPSAVFERVAPNNRSIRFLEKGVYEIGVTVPVFASAGGGQIRVRIFQDSTTEYRNIASVAAGGAVYGVSTRFLLDVFDTTMTHVAVAAPNDSGMANIPDELGRLVIRKLGPSLVSP